MRRTLFVMLAGVSLMAGPALAQRQGQSGSTGQFNQASPSDRMNQDVGQSGQDTGSLKGDVSQKRGFGSVDEPKKYLSAVDLYLENAMNDVKVIYESTQMKAGRADEVIQREAIGDIDRALGQALNHFQRVKAMPGAITNLDKADDFQRNLYQARSVVPQLRSAVKSDSRSQIQLLSSQLFTSLKNAGDAFGDIADKQKFTRIKDIDVPERQPVRGEDRDLDLKRDVNQGDQGTLDQDRGRDQGGRFQGQSPDQMPRPSNANTPQDTGDLNRIPSVPER
ncbi:MAG TPA: hypothetical protein VH877_12700 [Polyangia bacterium]|jgi:hypothetical protein|nr:hypothetical protein [Polyangia bacterium]